MVKKLIFSKKFFKKKILKKKDFSKKKIFQKKDLLNVIKKPKLCYIISKYY